MRPQDTPEQAIRDVTAALVRAVNGSDVDAVMGVLGKWFEGVVLW